MQISKPCTVIVYSDKNKQEHFLKYRMVSNMYTNTHYSCLYIILIILWHFSEVLSYIYKVQKNTARHINNPVTMTYCTYYLLKHVVTDT